MAAPTWQTPGTFTWEATANGTSQAIDYPASPAAGDLLIMVVHGKPTTNGGHVGSVTTPSGFTSCGDTGWQGGYGNSASFPIADQGDTIQYWFYKEADGSETTTITVTVADFNMWGAHIMRLTKSSGNWDVANVVAGGKTASGGTIAITTGSNPGITADDFLIGAFTEPTDVGVAGTRYSAWSITATSATIGAATEASDEEQSTGTDMSAGSCYATVTSGTASAAPVLNATVSGTNTNARGPGGILRVRIQSGITEPVGTATETDSVTGLSKAKAKTLTAATETDTITGLTKTKTATLGAATETETVTGLSKSKTKALGTATETDTVSGFPQVRALGAATETDTVTGFTRTKTVALGTATETETVTGLGKTLTLGTATESDAGVSVASLKSKTLTAATETDTVTGLGKTLSLGTATETDAAVDVTRSRAYTLGTATETDEIPVGDEADEYEYYDTGVDGAAIGTTDLIFDNGVNGATSTVTYDNDHPISGDHALSMKIHGVATEVTYRDVFVGGGSDEMLAHWREYFYIPTVNVAGANLTLLEARDDANTTRVCRVGIVAGTEFLRMQDGTTGVGTGFDMALLYDELFRLEWRMDRTNSQQTLDLFVGANAHGTSPDYTETTTYTTGSGMARMRIGQVTAPTSPDIDQWRGGLGWRLTDWCGPVGAEAITRLKTKALGTATETDNATGFSAGTVVSVGTAEETDTVTGLGKTKTKALGTATETNDVTGLTSLKSKEIGTATETDTVTGFLTGITVALGTATETDTAGEITGGVAGFWTFEPPESNFRRGYPKSRTPAGRLFPRIPGIPVRYTVMIFDADTTPRVVQSVRPTTAQMEAADYVYLGARIHELTETERQILEDAGYEDALVQV